MSLNADLADRIPILRRRRNSHISGKEVVQNVLESRLQLTAALGKQNVRLRESDRQIRLDELGVVAGPLQLSARSATARLLRLARIFCVTIRRLAHRRFS